ncbi:hypothetical protein [Desulfuromonas sp. CSMB_57]|uniref:hypothetical protein n=1 Tax=Desulfuromonas sp. CSMB_57 TaxID=2807629 RepID=UPI0020BED49F|nr:hypothetical protein [Desulfuromonas sp. CSMB_57]
MKSPSNINWKLVGVFVFLIVLSALYVKNQENTKSIIRNILEWDLLSITLWLGILCCFSVHYLSIRNDTFDDNSLIFKHFGKFADSIFAVVTYGLSATTSSALLKGVYIQQVFGDQMFFNNFSDIDIYSMLVVCLFLFGYSLYASGVALKSALLKTNSKNAEPVKT